MCIRDRLCICSARRLLALAAIHDGASPTDAARIEGVTLQTVRDLVVKFNINGPDGLVGRKTPGLWIGVEEGPR